MAIHHAARRRQGMQAENGSGSIAKRRCDFADKSQSISGGY